MKEYRRNKVRPNYMKKYFEEDDFNYITVFALRETIG